MDIFGVWFFVLAFAYCNFSCSNLCEAQDHFNVMDYGATSDGHTDDSKAFLKAWAAACSSSAQYPKVIVPPAKTLLVNPIIFSGPCHAQNINFVILGTIMAPKSPSSWDLRDPSRWLVFKDVNGLNVFGFGTIDGRGRAWWDQSCKYHPQLGKCTKLAPTAMKFLSCNGSTVNNLKLINSAQTHISLKGCNKFHINNVVIQSPGNSPNTDGIHIHSSHNVVITNGKIGCGDDCISIGDYISNIRIANIECGPGHGIRATCPIFNFILVLEKTGVQISNVVYKEIYGTSSTNIAINLNCSRYVPCVGISMESIELTSAKIGKKVTANCSNAHGQETDVVPGSCLLH
ncbi:Polygalacturonase [Handroanthus impetiginosus]|uniref:Polygalacturonase n=1 Tax=Handroanthus impetiginosus TaxID=429701 RepID=A0A2G9GBZ1_9LAMI|nr:Polygalacturonase [Handroanthus impetiginosus]